MHYLKIKVIINLGKKAKRYKKEQDNIGYLISRGGQSVIIYLMIVMFFSNHIYDMEAVSIIYAYAGIALNLTKNNRRIYAAQSNINCTDL